MNRMNGMLWRFLACLLSLVFLSGFDVHRAWAEQPGEEERILALFEARRQQIAEIMEAGTVLILSFDKDGDAKGMGSGFIVGDGLVMTNAHVVNDGASFKVMNNRLKATPATVVRKQGDGQGAGAPDFALLRFKADISLPILSFNTQIKRMDRVSAWGFPHMMTQFDQALEEALSGKLNKVPPVVYTEGTVNTLVRKGNANNIFHSAAIAAGNSGGPLVNSKGEVVGINTWGHTEEDEGAAIFAALPSEGMITFLQQCGVTPNIAKRTTLGVATAPTVPASSTSNIEASSQIPPTQTTSQTALQAALQAAHNASEPVTTQPATAGAKNDGDGEQKVPKDINTLLREANAGSTEAQFQLGYNYYYGEEVDENEQEAARWLRKAVAQGQNDAKAILGMLHIFSSTQKDVPQGITLLQQAADEDVDYAPILALLFYEGEGYGVARDVKKSFHYGTLGANAHLADAQALLGMLYLYGEMGKEDPRKAFELAQQAIQGESMLGQSLMAWLYYTGSEVKKDSRKAFRLAQDAAEAEESSAMGLLALLYYTGDGVDEDDAKAREWAQRASDAGNEFGHFILGCLFAQEVLDAQKGGKGGKKNKADAALSTAWAYLTMATEKGVSNARTQLETIEPLMNKAQKIEGKRLRDAWRTERGLDL